MSTSNKDPQENIPIEHQRGDVAILEGHEIHKYPIYLSAALFPGYHELGSIMLHGIGEVHIAVDVGKDGIVSRIRTRWPSEIQPEVISSTSHNVYYAAPGLGIVATGKAKCELIHAAGSCDGCSTFNWLEVVQLQFKTP